jgi:hypothetical protein
MIGFTVWAILLAVQKYRIGWMLLPKPIGIVPVPVTLWTESQKNLYKVGDILLVISFCLYGQCGQLWRVSDDTDPSSFASRRGNSGRSTVLDIPLEIDERISFPSFSASIQVP